MTKEWALSNGLNPILYTTNESPIKDSVKTIVTASLTCDENENTSKYIESVRYILAHTKPIDGSMYINDQFVNKEFYQESEWRYVASNEHIEDHLGKKAFVDSESLNAANESTKQHCSLRFTPKDIKYIFVKSDSDIPSMINFIQENMDQYPNVDIKVLMSRIISLESIKNDL